MQTGLEATALAKLAELRKEKDLIATMTPEEWVSSTLSLAGADGE